MKTRTKKGLTLVEIIVAIAILGIVFIAFQQIFYNGYFSVFTSGQRTRAIMDVQEIVDNVNTQSFSSDAAISNYLTTQYSDLLIISNQSNLYTYQNKTVNCFIGSLTTMKDIDGNPVLNDVYGYPVQFVLFFGKNTQKVQMTVFVIDQDANGG